MNAPFSPLAPASIESLYRDVVRTYGRSARYVGIPPAARRMLAENPSCGDAITVGLEIDEGRVVRARFEGEGCLVAMASASVLCRLVEGRHTEAIARLFPVFEGIVAGADAVGLAEALARHPDDAGAGPSQDDSTSADAPSEADLLSAFGGVAPFRTRRGCATLPWRAAVALLAAEARASG